MSTKGDFALPYSTEFATDDPDEMLLKFFTSTRAVAADLAKWDRNELKCLPTEGPASWRNRPHQRP